MDVGAAARILAQGGVVAFPTETVYGLGADARNAQAVSRVFRAKGRPSDNPLIVHVASLDSLHKLKLTTALSTPAISLAKSLWPGPLTLVLPLAHTARLAPTVTAGLNTVGVRVPQHPVAATLLAGANVPVAAPSANTSGRPSPTSAMHVLTDLDGLIDGVVDAGELYQLHAVGIESTVVDATQPDRLTVLRPGAVSRATLERISGVPVEEATGSVERPKAPGMKYRHYAPRAPMRLVEREQVKNAVSKALETSSYVRVGLWADHDICACYNKNSKVVAVSSGARHDALAAARGLYSALRDFDGEGNQLGVDIIIASIPENADDGIAQAVLNRLSKAASEGCKGDGSVNRNTSDHHLQQCQSSRRRKIETVTTLNSPIKDRHDS